MGNDQSEQFGGKSNGTLTRRGMLQCVGAALAMGSFLAKTVHAARPAALPAGELMTTLSTYMSDAAGRKLP